MVLRGDRPTAPCATSVQDRPALRLRLVALLKECTPIFCWAWPAIRRSTSEAPSFEADLVNSSGKVDAGASFVTTQRFRQRGLLPFRRTMPARRDRRPIVRASCRCFHFKQVTRSRACAAPRCQAGYQGIEAAGDPARDHLRRWRRLERSPRSRPSLQRAPGYHCTSSTEPGARSPSRRPGSLTLTA